MNESRLGLLCNTYPSDWEETHTGVLVLLDVEARSALIVGYTPSGDTGRTVELNDAQQFMNLFGLSGKSLEGDCAGQRALFYVTVDALNTIGSTVYFLRTDFKVKGGVEDQAKLAQHLFEVISDSSDPAHEYMDDLRILKNDVFGNTDVVIGV